MVPYPHINPVLISVGPVAVRWYGLMFLFAFAGAWLLGRRRAAQPGSTWRSNDVDDLIFFGAVGAVVGGRIGWVLLYGLEYELSDPLRVLRIWEGGMSFHGGLSGAILAMVLFARRRGRSVADVFDFAAALPGVGIFAVRVANFINGELWGKPTSVPWAVLYDGVPRHPSQLYEALLEGIVLGTVMWIFTARPRPRLVPSGLFLLGYGAIRFALEFVRVPDANRGYLLFGWVTEGQLLCVPMVIAGVILLWLGYRRGESSGNLATLVAPLSLNQHCSLGNNQFH
ncbi:MAG TPA: prolipoprotein diacylglyceryl transferase [Steroidobacteraceae bacterium]|nr:prolipoprotein diacylglyceryl transferase [Steroidobacteraceae bacterium]